MILVYYFFERNGIGCSATIITVKDRRRIVNASKGFINLIDAFIHPFSVVNAFMYPVFT